MEIKKYLTLGQFRSEFQQAGRGQQFSYDGLTLLYEHLESVVENTGEPLEFDVIGLCCDYTEYSKEEILAELEIDDEDEVDLDEAIENGDLDVVANGGDVFIVAGA